MNEAAGCLACASPPVYTELLSANASTCLPSLPTSLSQTEPIPEEVMPSLSSYQETSPSYQEGEPIFPTNSGHEDSGAQDATEGEVEAFPHAPMAGVVKKVSSIGLKDHIVFTPGNPPKYSCKKCNKSYNNRKAARYHNYCGAPDTEKPHTCDECGQGFITKGHLMYHVKSHTGSLPFSCKICGKAFKQLSKLNRHSKSHDGSMEKPFKCEMCDKAFSTKQILKDHQLSHSTGRSVICPICSKKLSSQSCLRKHKKLHSERKHICKDCGKKFPVRWSLEVHMKTHQRERKFKCKECHRAFKIHSDLKRHAVVHQDDGEWECKNCLLIFRRRDNLVRHLKNLHPESPRVISMKQPTEKGTENAIEEHEKEAEDAPQRSPSVCQAVSVIRTVPKIQKVQATLETQTSASYSLLDQANGGEWNSHRPSEDNIEINQPPSLPSCVTNSSTSTYQNYHRESVVCHSDARGVVYHGSSSFERVYDSNNIRTRSQDLPVHESLNADQCLPSHEILTASKCDDPSQCSRPEVIVANK